LGVRLRANSNQPHRGGDVQLPALAARTLEESLPKGADTHQATHQALLRDMTLELPGIRPAVLSESTVDSPLADVPGRADSSLCRRLRAIASRAARSPMDR
jgi:hypothetical protein